MSNYGDMMTLVNSVMENSQVLSNVGTGMVEFDIPIDYLALPDTSFPHISIQVYDLPDGQYLGQNEIESMMTFSIACVMQRDNDKTALENAIVIADTARQLKKEIRMINGYRMKGTPVPDGFQKIGSMSKTLLDQEYQNGLSMVFFVFDAEFVDCNNI